MEEPNADLHQPIQGAVSGLGGSEDFDQDDMPMVVWLRGDESYAGEFNVDAESAMKALGIKRSRLTQISGKELRVGRIRLDRYIRPVYRQSDIDAYLEWTRPTATHIKSSDVLLQAATELRSGSKEISDQINEQIVLTQERLMQNHSEVASETYRIQRESIRQLQENSDNFRQEMQQQFAAMSENLTKQISAIATSVIEAQAQQNLAIANLTTAVQDAHSRLISALGQSHEDSMRVVETTNDRVEKIAAASTGIEQSLDESYQLGFDNFAAIRETMDHQARFHRGVAEALAKIIEVQRELLQIRNVVMAQQNRNGKTIVGGKSALRLRRNGSGRALRFRKLIKQEQQQQPAST